MTSPGLARPIPPRRLRYYAAVSGLLGLAFTVGVVGTATHALAPTRTLDVAVNIVTILCTVLFPLGILITPGEQQSSEKRAAELVLIWLPFTAAGQLSFELIWLVGQPFGAWTDKAHPGWKWLWWQFAETDRRYFGENPFTFAMELNAVVAGALVAFAFAQLVRVDLEDSARIRALWIAFAGITVLTFNTLLYFVSELRDRLRDIGQGSYGVVKFVGLNVPYLIVPPLVMLAIVCQVNYLNQRVGVHRFGPSSE